jgi:hypothetical protein
VPSYVFDKLRCAAGEKTLWTTALEYATGNFKENQDGLQLNGTDQFLVYANDVNLLKESFTLKKDTETLLDARKEVGLK